MDIITDADLASYLETTVTPGLTVIVELVNDLIEESWTSMPAGAPVTIPAHVRALAFTVGARAAANPKGLSSWTRSWDDVTRTERMESGAPGQGVYLTDAEIAQLNGTEEGSYAVGTIRTRPAGLGCRPC